MHQNHISENTVTTLSTKLSENLPDNTYLAENYTKSTVKTEKKIKKTRAWFIIIISLVLVLAFGDLWFMYSAIIVKSRVEYKYTQISDQFLPLQKQAGDYKPPNPSQITLNTLFFGDVFWGRYVHEWSQSSELKEAYPFSGLNTFDRQNYDAWIGSLNCPITPEKITAAQQEALLKFNCTPEYLPEAAKWFNAFSLANSHTANMEEVGGFTQTKEKLKETGIQFFGHFDKDIGDDICEILSFKARVEFVEVEVPDLVKNKEYHIPVALCGYHNTFALPTDSQIAQITRVSEYFPTLVYAIQGSEYNTSADGLQRQYFRKMIDAGADAVIGKGAHVVQDSEAYKGKLIVYSMGNFIYDQQFSPDVRQGVAINAKLSFNYNENLEKWQTIAKTCQEFKDICLDEAKKQNLTKPEFKISYDFLPTDNSGKLAKKGDDSLRQKMSQRLGWEKSMSGLK